MAQNVFLFPVFLKNKGIELQNSCIHTPQQNDVVERTHRHILNVAHSLMFQLNVPLEFWGKCVLTVVYLINRIPTPSLSNKSPFEVLYIALLLLHIYGSLVVNVTRLMFTLNKNLTLVHLFVSSWSIHMDKKGIKIFIYKPKKYPSAVTYIFHFHSISFLFPQNSSPYFPLPHNISFDTLIQLISSPDFSPNSTLPLLDHNLESHTPSSDVTIPESSSPETTIPSSSHSSLPTLSSSSPSVTLEPSNPSPISTLDEPPLHRSTRHIQPPTWQKDYDMSSHINHSLMLSSSRKGTRYPLSSHLSFFSFFSSSLCLFSLRA